MRFTFATLLSAIALTAPIPGAASAQVRHVAATIDASRPDALHGAAAGDGTSQDPAEPEPEPLDRTFALSLTLGAGIAKWSDYVAYYNEEEERYDAYEVSGESFVVLQATGFAGLVMATAVDGHVEHLVGYLLDGSADDTAVLHRHQLAYRFDSRYFGLTVNLGLSAMTPFAGGPTATGAGFGIGVHAYVAGPLFAELRYQADMVGTADPSMKTYSLALGIANL